MTARTQTLKPGEIVPITLDYVFTQIFNNNENMIILENFIACYLDKPLKEIRGKLKLQQRELPLDHKKNANKQIDILVDFKEDKLNIELSNYFDRGVKERNIVYACNVHSRQLKHGAKNYNNINRTLQINLNCEEEKKHGKEMIKRYHLATNDGEILSEKFQIDIVDMVIAKEACYNEDKLARWFRVLMATSEAELKKALGDDLMEKEASEKLVEEVNKYSADEEVVALYMDLTREELERNTYIAEAKEEKTIEIAKNMLKKNIDKETIKEVTGLTIEELEKL